MTVPAPFTYNATVVDVHDGDTINVAVDLGFYSYLGSTAHPIPVRLLGCNAAELGTPSGNAACVFLKQVLPPGTPVVLTTAKPDKYAPRWDAAVEVGGIPDLTAYLIARQYAAAWDGNGTKPVPPWPRTVTP